QIRRIMANKLNLLATTDTPQGNDIFRIIGHNTAIISNASKRSESPFSFLIEFISVRNLCNSTYQTLRRKSKSSLVGVVNFVMEFEIIKDTFRPSDFRNRIADGIGFPKRFKKQERLVSSWKKFDLKRQFHNTNEAIFSDIRKLFINKGIGAFLTYLKRIRFPHQQNEMDGRFYTRPRQSEIIGMFKDGIPICGFFVLKKYNQSLPHEIVVRKATGGPAPNAEG